RQSLFDVQFRLIALMKSAARRREVPDPGGELQIETESPQGRQHLIGRTALSLGTKVVQRHRWRILSGCIQANLKDHRAASGPSTLFPSPSPWVRSEER